MALAPFSDTIPPIRTIFKGKFFLLILISLSFEHCKPRFSPPGVLVFSKTTGYRHACIPAATEALRRLCQEHGFQLLATENAAELEAENLQKFDAVVFLCTSGNVLDTVQEAALEQFIRSGGGLVGIHSAADTEYDWPAFGQLLGARFKDHPQIQPAQLLVDEPRHPATRHLPAVWKRTDEWYNFNDLQPGLQILIRIDETSYSGGSMGDKHPMAWCQPFGQGRVFYTALGHTEASYGEPAFLNHLLGGIQYATGQ